MLFVRITMINWLLFFWLPDTGDVSQPLYSQAKKRQLLSRVQLFAIPWTIARQAPLSMEFSRQEYWSGLSFPSPGDLPDPRIEPRSPALQAASLQSDPPGKHSVKDVALNSCHGSQSNWGKDSAGYNCWEKHNSTWFWETFQLRLSTIQSRGGG